VITAILFDGYGTLFHDALEKLDVLCSRIISEQNLEMEPLDFLNAWDKHFFPMIMAEDFVTLRESNIITLQRAFDDLGIDASPDPYVQNIFQQFSETDIYEDVKPALKALAHTYTGVLSNADSDHLESALRKNQLEFSLVISSESARCYKPKPAIFHLALEALRRKPEEVLYVGDSQEDDIVGAKGAGLPVAWLNRKGATRKPDVPVPDFEISTLLDLPKLL
jgi:2-haloacid dehalogenase